MPDQEPTDTFRPARFPPSAAAAGASARFDLREPEDDGRALGAPEAEVQEFLSRPPPVAVPTDGEAEISEWTDGPCLSPSFAHLGDFHERISVIPAPPPSTATPRKQPARCRARLSAASRDARQVCALSP